MTQKGGIPNFFGQFCCNGNYEGFSVVNYDKLKKYPNKKAIEWQIGKPDFAMSIAGAFKRRK